MFKKAICILMVFTLLLQVSVNVGIAVYYHLNKAEIAQKLCENKAKPQMHCNGHCYLSKQLKKAEQAEKKNTASLVKEKEELISQKAKTLPSIYYPSFVIVAEQYFQSALYPTNTSESLLKPPVA